MTTSNHIPSTAVSPAVSRLPGPGLRSNMIRELKLLFAALGAGGSVVPLGDNGRTAHLLAKYAETLRRY